jgi:hypothetical protein
VPGRTRLSVTDGQAGPILVVGSYPPVGTPGAAATLAAVRAAIAAGDDPVVASPRASAAPYEVAVSGVFAGRRLDHLRRLTGARHLILCAERDLPLPTRLPVPALLTLVQRRTLDEVRRAALRFDRVTLVIADDLGVPAPIEAGLRALASDVTDARGRYPGAPGVSVLGPDERTPAEQLGDLASKVSRRALGPLYPTVRQLGAEALRRARDLRR